MQTESKPGHARANAPRSFDTASADDSQCGARENLWKRLSGKRLSEIAFRRDQVFGSITAEFFAPQHHLAVFVNEPGVASRHWSYVRQDAQLRHMGFRVLRFTNEEVLGDMPLVLDSIVEVVSQIARRMRKI